MLIVGNVLLSEDIVEKKFVCDLNACKGACCVDGDSGAPLKDEETGILEEILEDVLPYLPQEGRDVLMETGAWEMDSDGDLVTPLVNGSHCAYTIFLDDGTASCGIEKAYRDGKVKFKKPISCHLYPIRVSSIVDTDALNYHKWEICKPACLCGEMLKVPVYKFLKEPLERAYGAEWYAELEDTAKAWVLAHKKC
jgi:hypothetical protein